MLKIKNIITTYTYSTTLAWKLCRNNIILLLLTKGVSAILPVALIWCTQKLVDSVTLFINEQASINNALLFFILEVLIILFTYLLQKVVMVLELKLNNEFGLNFKLIYFEKHRKLPFELFEKHSFQDKINRIEANEQQMIVVTNKGLDIFTGILSLIGIFIYLSSISWIYIPLLIISTIPLVIVQFIFGRKRYELFKFLTPFGRKEHYISGLFNSPQSLMEIRLYLLEDYLINKWSEHYLLSASRNQDILIKQSKWHFLTQFIQMISYFIAGFYTIFLMIGGTILVGSFVAVLQAIQRIQGTISNIADSLSELYESSFLISDFKEFLKTKEIKQDTKNDIEKIEELEVHNLTYQYPTSNHPAIETITINIPQGKKVAIVGENGSGKTTLLKCLTGIYSTKKCIKVNGTYLENLNISSYHNRMAVLTQHFNKFEFTARENIGFGRINNIDNNAAIYEATSKTNMHNYIMNLQNKYDHQLGRLFDNGAQLSGGQWQKMAISRALFRNSDVLILDEPTSSLDPKSELDIIESLFKQRINQSIIFITHRLETTRFADEIIVMEGGRIVEQGSPETLLELRGDYYHMYQAYKDKHTKHKVGGVQS